LLNVENQIVIDVLKIIIIDSMDMGLSTMHIIGIKKIMVG